MLKSPLMKPLLLILALTTSAFCADPWTLTTADFQSRSVSLRALDPAGLQTDASPQPLPWDQFLLLTRTAPVSSPPGPYTLHLIDDTQLTGQPLSLQDEQLLWTHPLLGQLSLPLTQLRSLSRTGRPLPSPDPAPKEDLVYLANGDTLRGIVSSITPPTLTLKTAADPASIPLETLSSILFAASAAPSTSPGFRLTFTDNSSLIASSLQLTGHDLTLTLPDQTHHSIALQHITSIEQINGPASWLSSRPPKENIQIPYDTSLTWPARMNLSVTGKPIRFQDRTYSRGIGVHAYSRLVYPLDGQYQAFRTQYALDTTETDGRYAALTIRIKLDDRIVHEQKDLKPDTLSPPILIPLAGAHTLTLEADYGPQGDRQARLNWIEPVLLRHLPPAHP